MHTPEFEFERRRDNVEEAARVHGRDYPIALDSNYATWNAYSNNSWPAKYLIDQHGDIRFRHLGEGAYAETEEKIRELLAETGFSVEHIPANSDPVINDRSFSADPARRLTRELYAGYERNPTLPSSAFAGLVGSVALPQGTMKSTVSLISRANILENLGSMVLRYFMFIPLHSSV